MVSVPTCTGDERLTVLFVPSCPYVFDPHDHNVPSVFIAIENGLKGDIA